MKHEIHSILAFEITAPYTLRLTFEDRSVQVIDFLPILVGEVFGPLRDLKMFNQVKLDPETRTVVWPNGADFDPALLHDWPRHLPSAPNSGRAVPHSKLLSRIRSMAIQNDRMG